MDRGGWAMPASSDLIRRRSFLTAARGFVLLDTHGKPAPPEVQTVRKQLENWTVVGHVVTGMTRQGYRLHPTRTSTRRPGRRRSRSRRRSAPTGFGAGAIPWRAGAGRSAGGDREVTSTSAAR